MAGTGTFTLRVSGVKETVNKFSRLSRATKRELKKHLSKTATRIRRDAARGYPYRSTRPKSEADQPHLRRTIRKRTSRRYIYATIRAHARHGIFVEFGTKKMTKRPSLKPALEKSRYMWVQGARRIISKTIRNP